MSNIKNFESASLAPSNKTDPGAKIQKALLAVRILLSPDKILSSKTSIIQNNLNFTPITSDLSITKPAIRIKLHRHGSFNTQESDVASKAFPQTPPTRQQNNIEANARISEETSYIQNTTTHTHSLKQLYEDAAAATDPDGQFSKARRLLSELEKKDKDDQDITELTMLVTQLIKRLATSHGVSRPGYSPVQLYLGNCYGEGSFAFEKSALKAFQSYWLGSKQNHPECTYRVAVCYQFGAGTTRNMLQALHYLRKSARLGFVPAMYKLGMMLLQDGEERRQGVSWLKRAVQSDPEPPQPSILHTLACAYETPGYALVTDLGYAYQLYHMSAELGYSPSQYRLAIAYETGNLGCAVDEDQALFWAERAASPGEPDAELLLSRRCLSKNFDTSYQWAEQAANKGNSRAMLAMAYYKEYGIGTKKDLDESRRRIDLAATKDDALAVQRIRELKREDSTRC